MSRLRLQEFGTGRRPEVTGTPRSRAQPAAQGPGKRLLNPVCPKGCFSLGRGFTALFRSFMEPETTTERLGRPELVSPCFRVY